MKNIKENKKVPVCVDPARDDAILNKIAKMYSGSSRDTPSPSAVATSISPEENLSMIDLIFCKLHPHNIIYRCRQS